jgi:adenine phosphoribosyltransferase
MAQRDMAERDIGVAQIRSLIKDVPDFPKPGIVFKDITPLLAAPDAFRSAVEHLARGVVELGADALLAIESRGFIFGTALAQRLELPMHLVRKQGKLPREAISIRYELEYGFDHLEVHTDAVRAGGRYLIVDDLVATGGTAAAVAQLVRRQGATVAGYAFLIELAFLEGRKALDGAPIVSLLTY